MHSHGDVYLGDCCSPSPLLGRAAPSISIQIKTHDSYPRSESVTWANSGAKNGLVLVLSPWYNKMCFSKHRLLAMTWCLYVLSHSPFLPRRHGHLHVLRRRVVLQNAHLFPFLCCLVSIILLCQRSSSKHYSYVLNNVARTGGDYITGFRSAPVQREPTQPLGRGRWLGRG